MEKDKNILLLGGNGFLGSGLRDELTDRNINHNWIDINGIDECDDRYVDLTDEKYNEKLLDFLNDATHVVFLAAKVGRNLFNADPIPSAKYNKRILDNVISNMEYIHTKYNKLYDVTFYSTCEIYGSQKSPNDLITVYTEPSFIDDNRKMYSIQKYNTESELGFLFNFYDYLSNLKIIRPFNVSGKHQRRGVVYDMVESAYKHNTIWYNDDTTRTLTSAKYAQNESTNIILSEEHGRYNLSENITVYMEELANEIANVVGNVKNESIELVKQPPDNKIRYRQTSLPDGTYDKNKLRGIILEVLEYIENDKK